MVIDKLREHRGKDGEVGSAYASALDCLGAMRLAAAAPSILLELSRGIITRAPPIWRAAYCASIAAHDAMAVHLQALANLPGFACDAAVAAVCAGRDLAPWLGHPFSEVRVRTAAAIRDDDERRLAIASVRASFAGFDLAPALDHVECDRPLIALPAPSSLVDGMFSPCADQRAWSIHQVSERQHWPDVIALAIADEIDAARAELGWPRTQVDWETWCNNIDGLPLEPHARAAHVRYLAKSVDLPAAVEQLVHGLPAMGPPKLELSADVLEAILDHERCELLEALSLVEELAKATPATMRAPTTVAGTGTRARACRAELRSRESRASPGRRARACHRRRRAIADASSRGRRTSSRS
jgi:hypothetical protein